MLNEVPNYQTANSSLVIAFSMLSESGHWSPVAGHDSIDPRDSSCPRVGSFTVSSVPCLTNLIRLAGAVHVLKRSRTATLQGNIYV